LNKPQIVLTFGDKRVATLVAQGLANKQIATELGLSEATVKWRVSRLLRLMCVPNRAALASTYRDIERRAR
jgi:DNA-binding NarL/FixJ family response regulator